MEWVASSVTIQAALVFVVAFLVFSATLRIVDKVTDFKDDEERGIVHVVAPPSRSPSYERRSPTANSSTDQRRVIRSTCSGLHLWADSRNEFGEHGRQRDHGDQHIRGARARGTERKTESTKISSGTRFLVRTLKTSTPWRRLSQPGVMCVQSLQQHPSINAKGSICQSPTLIGVMVMGERTIARDRRSGAILLGRIIRSNSSCRMFPSEAVSAKATWAQWVCSAMMTDLMYPSSVQNKTHASTFTGRKPDQWIFPRAKATRAASARSMITEMTFSTSADSTPNSARLPEMALL